MRIGLLCILGFFAASFGGYAQRGHVIKGWVIENENDTVPGASVLLLDPLDSTLLLFTTGQNNGYFELKDIPRGNFLLQVNSVGSSPWFKSVEMKDADINLGNINIGNGGKRLDEVTIEDYRIPIQMNGDTLEYNADAFKTKPNAVTEDLLKKLPGIEVAKDGSIKAQGENVKKVYVDGKEFFGGDPTMATKNIPADAIDKVQVYDKKTEDAEFTGTDDGEHEKAINLTLKKNKKNGMFGKAEVAYAHPELYYGKVNVHKFIGKTQLSVLGLANNMNESGFSFRDYADFMGGFQNIFSMGDDGNFNFDAGDFGVPIRSWGGSQGVSSAYSGAMNIDHRFNKLSKFNVNYSVNRGKNILHSLTNRKYSNADNPYSTDESEDDDDRNFSHRAGLRADIGIDSTQDIKIKGNFSYVSQNSLSYTSQNTFTGNNITQNQAYTNNFNDVTSFRSSGSLQYRKRFKKSPRNFSAGIDFNLSPLNSDTRLFSLRDFNDGDSIAYWRHDTLNQNQVSTQNQYSYGGNMNYAEPTGKNSWMQFKYKYSYSHGDQSRTYYDIGSNQEKLKNDSLSGTYETNYTTHAVSSAWNVRKGDHFFMMGVTGQYAELNGKVFNSDTLITKDFRSILPYIRYNYKFSKSSRGRIYYDTRFQAPSINQLQPLVNNTNPLKIYEGNPELKGEYRHHAGVEFNRFSQFSYTSWFISGHVYYTMNSISTSVTTDTNFVQVSKPVNTDHSINYSTNVYNDFPIKPLKMKMGYSLGFDGSSNQVYVNSTLDQVHSVNPSMDISFENRKKEIVDWEVGLEYAFTQSRYEINSKLNQTYYNYKPYASFEYYINDNWTLSSEFEWTFYKGNKFNANQDIAFWEASISYQFLKGNAGELMFKVYDILNQLRGFNQNTSVNYVQEQRYNTLGQYFMLQFTYSIKKMGGGRPSGH